MTQSPQPGVVLFDVVEPHIALVTINRPEARNAVNGAVAAELEAAVERVEADPDLWVAILTGAGPHAFCAGADLKEVSNGRGASLSTPKGGFGGFVRAPRTKLWIAAAQGHALAGGLELLLSCDLSVVAETANLGLPEVKRSLVAGAGGVFRLPRALPRGHEAQVRPRSGLALKNGITIPNSPGTIDADYRGEIQVILLNLGQEPFRIERGMRIAQLVVAPVSRVAWGEVQSLDGTARGAGGFGSTGTT